MDAQFVFYLSDTDPLQNLIVYLCAVLLVIINLLIIGIVGYKFIKKKAQNVFLLKVLRSFTSLLTTILFMPFLSLFLIITSCSLGVGPILEGCPEVEDAILLVSSIAISIALGMISFVATASLYELDYKSEDASARPHARVELVYLLCQVELTMVFTF